MSFPGFFLDTFDSPPMKVSNMKICITEGAVPKRISGPHPRPELFAKVAQMEIDKHLSSAVIPKSGVCMHG